jgi:hypothetical protein
MMREQWRKSITGAPKPFVIVHEPSEAPRPVVARDAERGVERLADAEAPIASQGSVSPLG